MIYMLYKAFSAEPSKLATLTSIRAIAAFLTAFLIVWMLAPRVIAGLYRRGLRDRPRDYVDAWASSKSGTPTMGGILIVLGILVSGAGLVRPLEPAHSPPPPRDDVLRRPRRPRRHPEDQEEEQRRRARAFVQARIAGALRTLLRADHDERGDLGVRCRRAHPPLHPADHPASRLPPRARRARLRDPDPARVPGDQQRGELRGRPRRPRDRARGVRRRGLRNHRLHPRQEPPRGRGRLRAARLDAGTVALLLRTARRRDRVPLVQRIPGPGLHGRHRLALARGDARRARGPDQAGAPVPVPRRRVRARVRLGPHPGHPRNREARPSHFLPCPGTSFLPAPGHCRDESGPALLDHEPLVRADRARRLARRIAHGRPAVGHRRASRGGEIAANGPLPVDAPR